MPPIRLEALTAAAALIIGRRYCSSHHGDVGSGAGQYMVRGNVRRWICFACKDKAQHATAAIKKRMRATQDESISGW